MADSPPDDGGSGPQDGVPDLGLPPRYAYQSHAPNSLGWWSQADGAEPPAAAQRPVDSDADPERALRLPLVPVEERHRVVLPPQTPWPIDGPPFALVRKEETMGRYVAPYLAPYLEPYNFVVPHEHLATVSPHGPGYDELAPGAAMQWLASWHQLTMSSDHVVRPSLAWVARVLSVILWCTQPRLDATRAMYGVVDGRPPDDELLLRLCRVGAIVGGGNLHALVCLAWFCVVDVSRRLAAALRACSERVAPDDLGLCVDRQLRDALAGVGAVPGHPLQLWSARSETLSSPFPHFVWGRRRPVLIADSCIGTLDALGALSSGQSRDRMRVPSQVDGNVRRGYWDDILRRNMHVYSDFSRRALRSAVLALRLVLHVAYRTAVYYAYGPAWDPRDPPHAYYPVLDRLAAAPVHRLHVMFDEFGARCSLARPVLWTLEAELYRTVMHLAPSAVHKYWGVPLGRPDSYDRAGALCLAGAYYIRIPIVPPSPPPGSPPAA